MKVAKAAEMREIDQRTIVEFGIPGVVLMENAGAAVARKVQQLLGGLADRKICIFAGKGNNGGDGFVIARYLANEDAKVKVFLLGNTGKSDWGRPGPSRCFAENRGWR